MFKDLSPNVGLRIATACVFALTLGSVDRVVCAAPPLVVESTEPKVSGDILRISAKSEGAKSYSWSVWTPPKSANGPTPEQIKAIIDTAEAAGLTVTVPAPEAAADPFMRFEGGKDIILPTWSGQEWVVFVTVSDAQGELASQTIHVRVPGGKPPVPPPDPPTPPVPDVSEPPAGEYGIALPLFREAMKVANRKPVASKIAAALTTAATKGTPQEMLNDMAASMKDKLTVADKSAWEAWRVLYMEQMESVKAKAGGDVAKWRQAFLEAGVGMAYVQLN